MAGPVTAAPASGETGAPDGGTAGRQALDDVRVVCLSSLGPVPFATMLLGGGGAYLALGVLAALHQRGRTGAGQVVDSAMVDGVASLTATLHGMLGAGLWPELSAELAVIFASRTRAEWERVFAGSDACVTPVLSLGEAAASAELRERATYVDWDGVAQPAPAPRLSASAVVERPRSRWCGHTGQVLAESGYTAGEIAALRAGGQSANRERRRGWRTTPIGARWR